MKSKDKWWLTKEQKERDIKKGIIRDSEGNIIKDGRIENPLPSQRDINSSFHYDANIQKPSFEAAGALFGRRNGGLLKHYQEEAKKRREQFKLEDKLKRGKSDE